MVRAGLVLDNVTPGKRVWSSRSGNYIPVVTGDRKTWEAFPGESLGGEGGGGGEAGARGLLEWPSAESVR